MTENHKHTKSGTDSTGLRSVEISTSFTNIGDKSLYKRLSQYCKESGEKEQDVIRHSVSVFLKKMGY